MLLVAVAVVGVKTSLRAMAALADGHIGIVNLRVRVKRAVPLASDAPSPTFSRGLLYLGKGAETHLKRRASACYHFTTRWHSRVQHALAFEGAICGAPTEQLAEHGLAS